jgi:WD40 repeat protein
MPVITFTIFVSSPGDVAQERFLTARVIDRLQNVYRNLCTLEPIFWEHEPLTATQSFQEGLTSPRETDVVVCILWSRLGTRLPRHVIGGASLTGTEYEFIEAVEGKRSRGLPDLLVYRKLARPFTDLSDRRRRTEAITQIEALEAFLEKWFKDDEGALIAAFHPFERADEFEEHLELHLRKLIDKRLKQAGISPEDGAPMEATWLGGSPFRGLEHFDFEHEPIFFGRTKAIGEVVDRLKRQAAAGTAFLLALGTSGCGKSSLVRAGVLPALSRPGVIEGVGLCRRAILRPGDGPGGLFDVLAAALLRPEALPELAHDGTTATQLARSLRANPTGASLLVKGAISQAASGLRSGESGAPQPEARLLFVVDQLEELFTLDSIPPDDRVAFARVLDSLARDPLSRTWVIAVLRSDFYAQAARLLELAALKEGLGQYDVLPPSPAEVGQLIREPAWAGGLRFEQTRDGERLDDVLRDEAVQDPSLLPLLEFMLNELYERRSERGRLTFEAYHALGGVKGALARRAESTYQALPAEVQAEFPAVFRQLVTISTLSEETPTRRQAALAVFEPFAARLRFVRAFIDARLFVADHDDHGAAVVRVTHESLLSRWVRVQNWLADDRELLRIKGRVDAATARWNQEGRPGDLLLPAGTPLHEARRLLAAGFELESAARELIEGSRRRAERNRRLRQAALVALCLLSLGMAAFAVYAGVQRSKAEQANQNLDNANSALIKTNGELDQARIDADNKRQAAEASERQVSAEKQKTAEKATQLARALARTEIQLANSRVLLAQQAFAEGDPIGADGLLEQVPLDERRWEWHYLKRKFTGSLWTMRRHTRPIFALACSPDGKLIASGGRDGRVVLWDAHTGIEVGIPIVSFSPVSSVAFSPDGKTLAAGLGADGSVILWDLAARKVRRTLTGHPAPAISLAYSSDGRRLVVGGGGGAEVTNPGVVTIWDPETGKNLRTLRGHTAVVWGVAISPDGTRVASCGYDSTVRIWDVASGSEVRQLAHPAQVFSVDFSPDGKWLASADWKTGVRVWDAERFGEPTEYRSAGFSFKCYTVRFSPDSGYVGVAGETRSMVWPVGSPNKPSATIPGNKCRAIAFSADGTRVMTAGEDAVIRVHDALGRADLFTIRTETDDNVNDVLLPDDRRSARALPTGHLQVVDVRTGRAHLDIVAHDTPARLVAASADGRRIVTASGHYGADSTRYVPGEIKVWDAANGALLRKIDGYPAPIVDLALNCDGSLLAARDYLNTARIWDVATGQVKTLVQFPDPDRKGRNLGVHVIFTPDGNRIGVRSGTGALEIRDARTGTVLRSIPEEGFRHHFGLRDIAFSADGEWVATGDTESAIRVWDTRTGERLLTLRGHATSAIAILGLAFNADRTRLVSAGYDHTVRIWDTRTGTGLLSLQSPRLPNQLAFDRDGEILTSSASGHATFWDGRPLQAPITLPAHGEAIYTVAFSPDGRRIAVGGVEGAIRLYDARAGTELPPLQGHRGSVSALAFSPDSTTLVSGGLDKVPRVWDVAASKLVRELPEGPGPIQQALFAPNGKRFAVSFAPDHSAGIYEAATGQPVKNPGPNWCGEVTPEARKWLLWQVRDGNTTPDGRRLAVIVGNKVEVFDLAAIDKEELAMRQFASRIDTGWHRRAATVHEKNKEWPAVVFHLRQIAPLNRTDRAFTTRLLTALGYCKQWDAVQQLATDWLADHPQDGPVYWLRATVRIKRGQVRDALSDLAQAVRFVPQPEGWATELEPFLLKGSCLATLGDLRGAERVFRIAIQRFPEEVDPRHHLCLVQLLSGRMDDYRATCRACLDAFASRPYQKENSIAWVCCVGACGKDLATQVLPMQEQTVRINPHRWTYKNTLGALYLRAGRVADAITQLNDAVKSQGEGGTPHDWYFLALAHHAAGRPAEAARCRDRAAALAADWRSEPWDVRAELILLRREVDATLAR